MATTFNLLAAGRYSSPVTSTPIAVPAEYSGQHLGVELWLHRSQVNSGVLFGAWVEWSPDGSTWRRLVGGEFATFDNGQPLLEVFWDDSLFAQPFELRGRQVRFVLEPHEQVRLDGVGATLVVVR